MNVYLNEAATGHCSAVMVDRSPATLYMSGDNGNHIGGGQIDPKRGNGVCIVRVKTNNEELFFNAFPFENLYYFISG